MASAYKAFGEVLAESVAPTGSDVGSVELAGQGLGLRAEPAAFDTVAR